MTADIEKMKALALAAMRATTAIKAEQALADFRDEASPAAVLELIAEVERLSAVKRPKDHNIRQLVNDLRNIAETFGGTQQLRARISGAVGQFIDDSFGAAPAAGTVEKDAERWQFRKQFLSTGGAIMFTASGCQLRRVGELVASGATEEAAIDAAIAAHTKAAKEST
jgi:hypothetical protein